MAPPQNETASATDLKVLISLMKEQQDRLNHLIDNPPGINKLYIVVIGALWVITMSLIGLTYSNLSTVVQENAVAARRVPVIEERLNQVDKRVERLEARP